MAEPSYQTKIGPMNAGPADPRTVPRLEMDLNALNERLELVVARVHDTLWRMDGGDGTQPLKGAIQPEPPFHLRRVSLLSDKIAELENLTKSLAMLV